MNITESLEKSIPDSRTTATEIWVGCDVAKKTFDAALWLVPWYPEKTEKAATPSSTFDNTKTGVKIFRQWVEMNLLPVLGPQAPFPTIHIVMEATGNYSTNLAVMLSEQESYAPAIINPRVSSNYIKSLNLRCNTDRTTARALARFGIERKPVTFAPRSELLINLRTLARCRLDTIATRVAEQQRLEELGTSSPASNSIKKHIEFLQRMETSYDQKMAKLIKSSVQLSADAKLLKSIKGVGEKTATSILAELGDLRRFASGKQLAAFAGLNPRIVESGTSVHKKPRLSKNGNHYVRNALYMSALCISRDKTGLGAFYHKLVDKGKSPKTALAAVMRKLLLLMRALVVSGKSYDPSYSRSPS